jgi:hypothetical protein
MKLPLLILVIAFAFINLALATNNPAPQLAELLSNPTSVGISSLSSAEAAQLQELESEAGKLNNCQIAVRAILVTARNLEN